MFSAVPPSHNSSLRQCRDTRTSRTRTRGLFTRYTCAPFYYYYYNNYCYCVYTFIVCVRVYASTLKLIFFLVLVLIIYRYIYDRTGLFYVHSLLRQHHWTFSRLFLVKLFPILSLKCPFTLLFYFNFRPLGRRTHPLYLVPYFVFVHWIRDEDNIRIPYPYALPVHSAYLLRIVSHHYSK